MATVSRQANALVSILNQVLTRHPKRILVIGCGTGEEAGILARAFKAETIGIDLATDAFDHQLAYPAKLLVMDARNLTFNNAYFDFVYSFHALEHITDPRRALIEMSRVLKRGGHYLIGTPNKSRVFGYIGSDEPLKTKILWNAYDWSKRLQGKWSNELGAHAGFTKRQLMELCAEAFGSSSDVSGDYFLARYREYEFTMKWLINSGLCHRAFPSVYVYGHQV